MDLNCIIEIHLVRASTWSSPESNRNNPIELIVLIKDSKDEEIIYGLNKPLVDVVNSQEYLSFKKSFNPSSAESILSVTVKKHESQESNVKKDQYGRPLEDEKGRWITYPDQEQKQKPDTASTNYQYSKKASALEAEIRQKEAELNSMVRKPDTAPTNYQYSKKASEIRRKEAELNSMVRNLTPGNLDAYMKQATEIAAKKGEINRLNKQLMYEKYPEASRKNEDMDEINERIRDLEFELEREKRSRKTDKILHERY